jgi:hypothetical protein
MKFARRRSLMLVTIGLGLLVSIAVSIIAYLVTG